MDDCPVVAHFSGNDPQKLLRTLRVRLSDAAASSLSTSISAVRSGARTEWALGAFLCDPVDRTLLLS